MIYDSLTNEKLYSKNFKELSRAIAFIKKLGRSPKDGRYPIDSYNMYAVISSYRTKMDRTLPFEAHKKYIDVQCILQGGEKIDIAHGKRFRIKDRYAIEKDILFIHPPKEYASILLEPGLFCVLFPQDYHRPGQGILRSEDVCKLVIKILIDNHY